MNTTENNKIIAEFMGHHLEHPLIDTYAPNPEEYKYNSDWNWLMEVVEKIESLGFIIRITLTQCSILNQLLTYKHTETQGTKIQAVYNACVEFIKWYEQNK